MKILYFSLLASTGKESLFISKGMGNKRNFNRGKERKKRSSLGKIERKENTSKKKKKKFSTKQKKKRMKKVVLLLIEIRCAIRRVNLHKLHSSGNIDVVVLFGGT